MKPWYDYFVSSARSADKAVLKSWEEGVLTTSQAIGFIRVNNGISSDISIGIEEFEREANALGYYRN